MYSFQKETGNTKSSSREMYMVGRVHLGQSHSFPSHRGFGGLTCTFWETQSSLLKGEILFGASVTGERNSLKSFTSSSLDSSRIKSLILQNDT